MKNKLTVLLIAVIGMTVTGCAEIGAIRKDIHDNTETVSNPGVLDSTRPVKGFEGRNQVKTNLD